MAVADVANICEKEARCAVKAAERAVRDVVVMRCRLQAAPGDRGAFLEAAEEAFGRPLDRELRAVLLLAYHKVAKGKIDTFPSNSQLATARRGRPKPRRQRAAGGDAPAGPAPEDGGGDGGGDQGDKSAGVDSSSLMSSSMPSTSPNMAEPRFGPLPCTRPLARRVGSSSARS